MAEYLVELYLPGGESSCALAAAAARHAQGHGVRYRRTYFLAEEEICFHHFEATSSEALRDALREASIRFHSVIGAEVS